MTMNTLAHTFVELQISCGICTQISPKSVLWRSPPGNRSNIKATMRTQGSEYTGSRGMSRPCSYAHRDTTKIFSKPRHGIRQRKK